MLSPWIGIIFIAIALAHRKRAISTVTSEVVEVLAQFKALDITV